MVGFSGTVRGFRGTSLVRSAYTFDEIRLTLPFGLVHLRADGTLNLLGLRASGVQTAVSAGRAGRKCAESAAAAG
ncbi:MAG: hypothetical protein MRJ92_04685 [Nitrospira sp.]|nr:hypothetical protein [Nitrospira sp.]